MSRKPPLQLLRQMVGNDQAYALQQEDGTYRPVREPLTVDILRRHLAEEITVGTYVNDRDKAKFLCFDIDSGQGSDAADIKDALEHLGVPSIYIGIEDSGSKGFHVWVIFRRYESAKDLRRIGRAVLALSEIKCEVFPKQDVAKDLGNLVKLVGSKHQVTGNQNNFIPQNGRLFPQLAPPGLVKTLINELPEEPKGNGGGGPTENPYECMDNIQQGVSEGGRNNALFHLAVMLRKNGVNDHNTGQIISYTAELCDPPYGASEDEYQELEGLIESSKRSGPLCNQLDEDIRCSECPFNRQGSGLFIRPGQIRHGRAGQKVVLEIANRSGEVVRLRHPDLIEAKGALE